MNKKLIIYTDGGARGNPGPAAAGVVIYDESRKTVKELNKYLGDNLTNNQAEYWGVILALEEAAKIGAEEINFYLDSELVVNQLKGDFKVKDKILGTLFVKIWNLARGFKKISYYHVPRAENKRADWLVNQALDRR